MVVDMKAKNKQGNMGKPKSLPGTPAGKNKGNFQQQKKSLSPMQNRPQGGGSPNKPFTPKGQKGTPGGGGGKQFGNKNNSSPGGGGGGAGKKFEGQKPGNKQFPKKNGPGGDNKPQQNGKANDALKQLDKKSKTNFKGKGNNQSAAKQAKNAAKKSKTANRYQRFHNKLNSKVRTPQACARAFKAEQELSQSQGRVLKITLPDPVITTELVSGWSNGIESILFGKPLVARQFTIVLKSGVNVKKEMEKFSKITVGNGKLIVKEQDPADVGHAGGQTSKDPSELIDPYTLYVTNLPDSMTKIELEKLFQGSTTSQPKKHNPKMGNASKFAFVTFDTPEAALAALKDNFNKTIEEKSIVMRFRRLNQADLRQIQKKDKNVKAENAPKVESVAPQNQKAKVAAKAGKAAQEVKNKQDAKKQNPKVKALKQEPADEDDDDDDEDDDEEMDMGTDDDDDSDDGEGMEEEDDDDDDDEEGDDDEDDDDDDDDDDE